MALQNSIVNLFTFGTGLAYSWSSPVIPKLNGVMGEEMNPLGCPVSPNQLAWMVAMVPFGAIFGCPLGGALASRFGKKYAMLLSFLPMLISYLMTSFATDIYSYFIAKFLSGVGCGCCYTLVPLYVGEVSDKVNRGKYGCFFGIFIKLGTFFSYAIGPYTSVQTFSLLCAVPMVVFLVWFWAFFPETPYYLVEKGDIDGAEKVLKKLRRNEEEDDVQCELTEITEYIKENRSANIKVASLFHDRAFKRSFVICTILLSFQQLSGVIVIISYSQSIFQEAGSKIPSHIASIVTGVIQVLSACITSQFVDRYGRRILLIISTAMISFSLALLGTYFYMKNHGYDVHVVYWIPLLSLCLYYVSYCLGIGPVIWAMMGELFDSKGKSAMASIANCLSKIITFVITLVFPYVSKSFGMEGSFWLLAFFMFLGLVFTVLFVPETKCKSFAQIKLLVENRLLQI